MQVSFIASQDKDCVALEHARTFQLSELQFNEVKILLFEVKWKQKVARVQHCAEVWKVAGVSQDKQ